MKETRRFLPIWHKTKFHDSCLFQACKFIFAIPYNLWGATTKGTQSRWQRTALHALTSCVTQFCWFRVNFSVTLATHSPPLNFWALIFIKKWLKSFSPSSGPERGLLYTKTRRIWVLRRMKPLQHRPCVTHQWKPHFPADSLLASEWTFFVPESCKSPPNLVNKL